MHIPFPKVFLILLSAFVTVLLFVGINYQCERLLGGGTAQTFEPELLSPGYVLVPVMAVIDNYDAKGEVHLIDNSGVIVHTWKTRYTPLAAYLQDNGDIVVSLIPPLEHTKNYPAGTAGIIERISWGGKVLWSYEDPRMNHDFEVLPDDSIAYLRWDRAPFWFHASVVGGMPTGTTTTFTNELVVLDAERNVKWTWHIFDHFNPRDFAVHDLTPNSDWAHANSLRYVPDNSITHTPAYLISIRNISTVVLLDATTGEVIWNSPHGLFSLQHDATYLPNGNILVFDNGFLRKDIGYLPASQIVEIDPRTDDVVSVNSGGEEFFEKILLSSTFAGGAEQLSNGNRLITFSSQNRLIELSPDNKLVWEYTNNFIKEGVRHSIFKARKYGAEGTGWQWKLPLTTPLTGIMCKFLS